MKNLNDLTKKDKEEIKSKIINQLKKEDAILFAYLYGSFARSKLTKKSDIDIGIYLKNKEISKFFIENLNNKLEDKIKNKVDLRILNERNLIFLHQVLKDSELLFSKNEKKRVKFGTYVYDRYLDFKYYIKQYNETRRKRILS